VKFVAHPWVETTGTWGMAYVDKVKSVKKTLGFPNQGERYGAKYENGVAYLLSYTVSVEKMWTQNTRIIHDV
jgi:hypothetical protein